jgi:hypothetical protein
MKTVILCGGKGTRLREETEYRPKPMVPIGNRPILWHIMKRYAQYGHKDFVLCLGYKGDVIKDYFRNYRWNSHDVTVSLGKPAVPEVPRPGQRRGLEGVARRHGPRLADGLAGALGPLPRGQAGLFPHLRGRGGGHRP